MVSPRPTTLMTLAAQRFDRSAPLFNRTVPLHNINTIQVPAGRPGVEGVINGVFDAAEMPVARYTFLKSLGEPLTAVPVFPDRLMVHQYVYTRPDTGINTMSDLRGRHVLLTGYFVTASFWHRAMLQEEYGIAPSEVEWHVTGPELDPRMTYPDDVRVTVTPGPFWGMELLAEGKVDALMTEGTAPIPAGHEHDIKRVIADPHAAQRDFYRRTGAFPIVHVIVVRKDAIERWPDFGLEICRAYDEAKRQTYRALQNERMTSLPLMRSHLDETMELFGDDPWPYGLEANRAELERYMGYAHDQGMTARRVGIGELFDERALTYEFTARMQPGSVAFGGASIGAVI